MRHSRTFWGAIATVILAIAATSPAAAPTDTSLPLVLYGAGEQLGGHFPLAELVLGDATALADDVARQIELRTMMTVSRSPDAAVAMDPHRTPVLLLTVLGPEQISSSLRDFILEGGFVVCAPQDDAAGHQLREWARSSFPNAPLMELPRERLARADEALPASLRSLSGASVGLDALRIDGDIRLLMPNRLGAPRAFGAERHVVGYATSSCLIGALRSPYVKRIASSPIELSAERDGARVRISASVPEPVQVGRLRVALIDVDNREVCAEAIQRRSPGSELSLTFTADVANTPFHAGDYWVRAEWQGEVPLRRVGSLAELIGSVHTEVRGQSTWRSGSPASIRVVVRDGGTGEPLEGASVEASVRAPDTRIDSAPVTTDATGTGEIAFTIPDGLKGEAQLHVLVRTEIEDDEIVESIRIEDARKILLTTDKPLYQPGQQIHVRALTLREGDLHSVDGGVVTFEIDDAKGNKVFKHAAQRNDFGVAYADFPLADELNLGAYTIRAVDGEWIQEKTVTVDRYVLPKFAIVTQEDRTHYRPGETVSGSVQADYFFGKPVAGGSVEIVASKFDVGWDTFAKITGKTGESGRYSYELDLPTYFAGLPLERGDSFVQLEIIVRDTAEHSETVTKSLPVVESPINVVVVPESGELIPGVDNELYVVTTTPAGEPIETTVRLTVDGEDALASSDALGITTFHVTPESGETVVHVFAEHPDGRRVERTVELASGTDQLLLRTSRSAATVGDEIGIEVLSTHETGPVYIDVVRGRQTILAKSAVLVGYRASVSYKPGPNDFGTLVLHAYQIGRDGNTRRDTRVVYVEPAEALQIDVRPNQDEYRPGAEGVLRFHVQDTSRHPVLAALGVQVVDEAVFAKQEMQPGLEKVFFLLEKELLQPRIEVHGFDPDYIVRPTSLPEPVEGADLRGRRDRAAKVLFAAAEPLIPDYTLSVHTRELKARRLRDALLGRLRPTVERIAEQLEAYAENEDPFPGLPAGGLVRMLVDAGYLTESETRDPWGHPLLFQQGSLSSTGPDGKIDTSDDVSLDGLLWSKGVRPALDQALGIRRLMFARRGQMEPVLNLGAAEAVLEDLISAGRAPAVTKLAAGAIVDAAVEGTQTAPTRVREFFPETLLYAPSVLTDANGNATLTVPLADSITTWRLTAMASSRNGLLGSTTAGIRVFQDFFVDLDLPVSLTVGDETSVPVAIYNYLEGSQTIGLTLDPGDWFEPLGETEIVAELDSGQVTVRYFRIRVNEPGNWTLTVRADGSKLSDAVRRRIEVVPDGREIRDTLNDRLSGSVDRAVRVPPMAVEGAGSLFVKLYPGVFSQVTEGLDSILQMPFGCFEQTSSATYPNILALDYMSQTGQNTPEIRMKAQEYITIGYQRLLSYEVDAGGFEWFGNAPANQILTAYGLMEFHDMARVSEVDPAVISRTQQWLLSRQQPDGSWAPDAEYIHGESWARIQDNELLPTAYVLWSLAESGLGAAALQRGTDYLASHWHTAQDPYMLAIIANAFIALDPHRSEAQAVLERLREAVVEDDDAAYWDSGLQTMTHARGPSSRLETTGLAALAFIRSGRHAGLVNKVLTHLIRSKDPNGTWHTTQATVLALKALLQGAEGGAGTDGTVAIALDGQRVADVRITLENSDTMRLVGLGQPTRGDHTVTLDFSGEGAPLYQIVARYYMPWLGPDAPASADGAHPAQGHVPGLTVNVDYDRTRLEKDDVVAATCTVANLRNTAAKMVVVDLGLPPGFELLRAGLQESVSEGVIERFDVTPRQVIVYFDELVADEPVTLSYELRAKYPIRAKTRPSKVYAYYNPEDVAVAAPNEIEVEGME